MTVLLTDVRKVAVVSYDTNLVKGVEATVEAEAGGVNVAKRIIQNHGTADVFFPTDFTGQATLTIRGSTSGEDTGTVELA